MGAPMYFQWEYHSIVECGSGCRTFVAQRFLEMGAKRVALITDPGIVAAGIVDQIKDIFEAQGQPRLVGIYDKIEQDAVMRVINDCARWCRENAIDGLLAVGGGSVLDTVKAVKVMLGMGATDIHNLMPSNVGPFLRPYGKPLGVPHVAMPTTAGTGAESSPVAVIYNEEAKVKGDMLHPYMPADYALLDPDFTLGLPPKMTAYTGFDALSHAIEGLTSPGTNCMINSLNIQAIRLIKKYLPVAVADGRNLEARTKMLVASNMAIMGFCMSGMFYPVHNVAHAAGGQLRIPHGQAVATVIPNIMEAHPQHFLAQAEELALALGVRTEGMKLEEMVAASREAILDLMDQCGIKPYFEQNLDEQMMETMYWAVKLDPSGIAYPIPDEAIRKCLKSCFR